MYAYYALWMDRVGVGDPVGIIVLDARTGDALAWDHRQKAWMYDPAGSARILFDDQYFDRFDPVDRETAERVTLGITGRQELPDEETIAWAFQWKGKPPQSED